MQGALGPFMAPCNEMPWTGAATCGGSANESLARASTTTIVAHHACKLVIANDYIYEYIPPKRTQLRLLYTPQKRSIRGVNWGGVENAPSSREYPWTHAQVHEGYI